MKLTKAIFTFTLTLVCLTSCNDPVKPVDPTPPTPTEKVIVTLDPDGGTISITSKELDKGTTFSNSLFPAPTKTDETFEKWCFTNGEDIPNDYKINENITIKAHYISEISEDQKYINSLKIKPVGDTTYLYHATYKDYDYEEGRKYLDQYFPKLENGYYIGSNCSSIRQKQYYGRNFDWKHGTIPEFIINTPATNARHATLGVSFCINLSNKNVNTTNDVFHHKMAPFSTVDGVNDQGVCVSINDVDKKDVGGTNTGTHPDEGLPNLNSMMIVRYLLDYANSVKHAEELLSNQNVYTSRYLNEHHIMIADKSGDTAVIEFNPTTENNGKKEVVFIRNDPTKNQYFENISTNFTFLNYKGDSKDWHKDESSLTDHAQGVERYNILYDKLYGEKISLNSLDDVLDLMSLVYYTKTYSINPIDESDNFWWSDYNYDKLTKKTDRTYNNYKSLYNYYYQYYQNKTRSDDNKCYYNSLHSSAYDMDKLVLSIRFEEVNKTYTYNL